MCDSSSRKGVEPATRPCLNQLVACSPHPSEEKKMPYRIAGIDVHKNMLAVVIADVEGSGEYQFERRKFVTTTEALRQLAEWLNQQAVQEVVMESTAQYWRPVWGMLEQCWQPVREQQPGSVRRLHLAQAKSNAGRPGRKNDFPDAERLVKRLVARELV